MKIYLVLHHEIMSGCDIDDYRIDEMVFYTARSLKKAISLIKESKVDKWSWWEIQSQEVDSIDWPVHVGYYGLRGGKLTKKQMAGIYEKCLDLFKKLRRN